MRELPKTEQVYRELSQAIASGKIAPGARLPRETDLAQRYGVSRVTLRSALARLEDEALVRRVQGRGTFAKSARPRPTLTFLMPSPAAIHSDNRPLLDVFQGVLDVGRIEGCQVETLVVAPNDDRETIDLDALAHLTAESRVVMVGQWFSSLFPRLRELGCRVAFVYDEHPTLDPRQPPLSDWLCYEKALFQCGCRLMRMLIDAGCREPLILYSSAAPLIHAMRLAGVAATRTAAGLLPPVRSEPLHVPMNIAPRRLAALIREQGHACPFDSVMLLDWHIPLQVWTEAIPPSMPFVQFCNFMTESPAALPETYGYSVFPLRKVGRDAARRLLADDFRPGLESCRADIHPMPARAELAVV